MLVALVVVLVGLLVLLAVRQGRIEDEQRAKHVAVQAQPPSATVPTATVELPPKGFSLADVLGKAKHDVDRVLGNGEQLDDGPWNYGFGKVGVLVVFEAGRAVFVSVTAPGFRNTDADRAAVLSWMQAPPDVDFDQTHKEFGFGVWAPGAQARQFERRKLAEAVSVHLQSSGIGLASATYTRLEVAFFSADSCTRATLAELARKYSLKYNSFDSVECLPMGANFLILQLP